MRHGGSLQMEKYALNMEHPPSFSLKGVLCKHSSHSEEDLKA